MSGRRISVDVDFLLKLENGMMERGPFAIERLDLGYITMCLQLLDLFLSIVAFKTIR